MARYFLPVGTLILLITIPNDKFYNSDIPNDTYTMSWQEDLEKFPNCLNSIPNENSSLKKENEQNFFCKYVWTKKSLLLLENCWSRPKIMIFAVST